MFKMITTVLCTICLAGSAVAADAPVGTSGSDIDLSTFSTEPFPNESFTVDNNYLLLFDELSGKTVYVFFAGTQRGVKPRNIMPELAAFFPERLEMDCLKVKDTIHGIGPGFRGKGGSTLPGAVTNVDDFVSVPTGGIYGITAHIWETKLWQQLGEELQKHDSIKLFESTSPANRAHIVAPDAAPDPRFFAEVSRDTYARLQKRKLTASYRPHTVREIYNDDDAAYRRRPVQLSGGDDGMPQTHGPDHDFAVLLDRKSGLLAVFLEYSDTVEPRDLDILKIGRRIDPDSLRAAPWNHWSSGAATNDVRGGGVLRAPDATLRRLGEKWELSLKQDPKADTVFTIRRDLVFGTVRPIWELAIWPELGQRIREGGNAYLLYFNDEDVRDLKRPEISQSYLVVTADLYAAMDALRQAAEKADKLKDEREALKEMMSE
jgi:hypothetical protein